MSKVLLQKGQLPYGWMVKTSNRYPDRVYYFNIFTGSSTWECPELDPPRSCYDEGLKDKNLQVKKDVAQVEAKPKLKDVFQLSSSTDGSKLGGPPTAIVVPVPHKPKTEKRSPCKHLPGSSPKKVRFSNSIKKIKRDTSSPSNTSEPSCLVKKKKKKKKKISPLNQSDLELEQKTSKTFKKLKKESPSTSSKTENDFGKSSRDRLRVGEIKTEADDVIKTEADDVEMFDVEGSMEELEEITLSNETVVDTFASYYVVVDTNVLIAELHLINELKDTPVNGCGPPHIFIPWVVIQELDKLKSNKNNKNAWRGACDAIRYLNTVLGKHPRFHGQSPAEAESWAKTYSRCNDDRILECCMALGDKMASEKVILLTNDKNLINKALICSINVHDWKSMMNSVKPDVIFDIKKAKDTEKKRNYKKPVCLQEMNEKQLVVSERNLCKKEIHTMMSNARQLLKNVLEDFVKQKMSSAYGKTWILFPFQWHLLEGKLLAMIRHWNVVFSEFLDERQKSNIEFLYKIANRPEGFYCDREECLQILTIIEEVFVKIKARCPKMKIPIKAIQSFRCDCVEAFSVFLELDRAVKETEQAAALGLFEVNWSAMNHLCGVVLDFCNMDHEIQYVKPETVPSEVEVRKLLCNFFPGVQQLKMLMSRMNDALQNNHPTKQIANKLQKALKNFIPSLEIPVYETNSYPAVTAQTINDFCISPRNREMIRIGCKQVENFFCKLEEAITMLMASKFGKRSASSPERMVCD